MENSSRTEKLAQVRVSEIMTKEIITVDHDDLIGKASRLMLENHLHSILVLKYSKPTYVLSAYDLMKVSYEDTFDEDRGDMLRTKVETLVEGQKMKFLPSSAKLLEALKIFTEYSIHSIPIIDDGIIKGMLSLMDLAHWYVASHEEIKS